MAKTLCRPRHAAKGTAEKKGPVRRRQTRAFTLVEVLAAGGIFLLGLAGIMAADMAAAHRLAASGQRERAVGIADSISQLAHLLPEAEVQGMSKTLQYDVDGAPVGGSGANSKPFFTAQVAANLRSTSAQSVSAVQISVSWQDPATNSLQQLSVETWVPRQ